MKLSTISNAVLLSLSLSLVGCGGGGGSDDTPEVVAPVVTPSITLSVVNPIADITASVGDDFDFSLPTDVCVSSDGSAVTHTITNLQSSLGLTLVNLNQLIGTFNLPGVVTATVTCTVGTENLTDEFSITVADVSLNPTVTINAPDFAKANDLVLLTANAVDANTSGSIVSYLWEQTSGPNITFIGNSTTSNVSFSVPDTTTQSQVTLSVTVTDNDNLTATESVEIDLVSSLAPTPTLSFPLQVGTYNSNEINMFGNLTEISGHAAQGVTVTLNDQEHIATISNGTWRVEDVTFDDDATILIAATSTDSLIGYEEINLKHNTIYTSTIDKTVVDIAVDESNDDLYVQLDGDLVSDAQLKRFSLNSTSNETITVSQPTNFDYALSSITSISLDTTSDNLLLSYSNAITTIDLATSTETILSDINNGTGTAPTVITDLAYDSASNMIYASDNVAGTIIEINPATGNRVDLTSLTATLSISVDSTNAIIYAAENNGSDTIVPIDITTGITSSITTSSIQGSVSDIAINEAGNELFFVDETNNLIKLDITTGVQEILIGNLFSVESQTSASDTKIGLHYHSERNVIIAVGTNSNNATFNKLVVIDPISKDYGILAEGNAL